MSLNRALGGTRLSLAPQGGEEKGPAIARPLGIYHRSWLVSCIPDLGPFIDKNISLFAESLFLAIASAHVALMTLNVLETHSQASPPLSLQCLCGHPWGLFANSAQTRPPLLHQPLGPSLSLWMDHCPPSTRGPGRSHGVTSHNHQIGPFTSSWWSSQHAIPAMAQWFGRLATTPAS